MSAATAEQLAKFQTVIQHLDQAPSSEAANRRRAPRINARLPLEVLVLGGAHPTPVNIYSRNFSISGIGFVSRRTFKLGERVVIKLRGSGLSPKLLLACITFSRYASGGHYETGAEFLDSIADTGSPRLPAHWLARGPAKPDAKP